MIEDIYKHLLKLRRFDHLINMSRYFIDFGLMAFKGEKHSYLFYFSLLSLISNPCLLLLADKFKKREYGAGHGLHSQGHLDSGCQGFEVLFGGAKHVRSKLEHLSKESTNRCVKEVLLGLKKAKSTKSSGWLRSR